MTANRLVLLGEQRMDNKHPIDRAIDLAVWVACVGFCLFLFGP
jgi:hypothetical protein